MIRRVLALTLLVLPTSAHAVAEEWETNFRRCDMTKFISKDDMDNYVDGSGSLVFILPGDIPAIERGLVRLKQCKKFWECVNKRDEGKVKHCYLPKKGLHK